MYDGEERSAWIDSKKVISNSLITVIKSNIYADKSNRAKSSDCTLGAIAKTLQMREKLAASAPRIEATTITGYFQNNEKDISHDTTVVDDNINSIPYEDGNNTALVLKIPRLSNNKSPRK